MLPAACKRFYTDIGFGEFTLKGVLLLANGQTCLLNDKDIRYHQGFTQFSPPVTLTAFNRRHHVNQSHCIVFYYGHQQVIPAPSAGDCSFSPTRTLSIFCPNSSCTVNKSLECSWFGQQEKTGRRIKENLFVLGGVSFITNADKQSCGMQETCFDLTSPTGLHWDLLMSESERCGQSPRA